MDNTVLWPAAVGIATTLVGAIGVLWRTIAVERAANANLRKECDAEKTAYVALIAELRKAHYDEMQARIGDAQAFGDKIQRVQELVITTVNESKISDSKVASEIAENTKATRELTQKLGGPPPRGPMKSSPNG